MANIESAVTVEEEEEEEEEGGTLKPANPAVLNLCLRVPEEAIGRTCSDPLLPETLSAVKEA